MIHRPGRQGYQVDKINHHLSLCLVLPGPKDSHRPSPQTVATRFAVDLWLEEAHLLLYVTHSPTATRESTGPACVGSLEEAEEEEEEHGAQQEAPGQPLPCSGPSLGGWTKSVSSVSSLDAGGRAMDNLLPPTLKE